MVHDGKAYQYATWCVDETDGKVPKYVKKQARDWINMQHFRWAGRLRMAVYYCNSLYKAEKF